jgi:hypothetical protein
MVDYVDLCLLALMFVFQMSEGWEVEDDHHGLSLFIAAMACFIFIRLFTFLSIWILTELIIWYVVLGGTAYNM